MELRDLIVTPFFILLVYAGAHLVRPYVCDGVNYRYFFPALTVKIIGALAVGVIYQFYYDGGDTYNFHTHGSRHIWNAFVDDPFRALQLIFLPTEWHSPGLYTYTSRIVFYYDPQSYFVVRVASFFDLLTFSTYSSTAVCFAVLSFIGGWCLFLLFYEKFPQLHFKLAIAVFFIPSVFCWGSGLLKDTLVMSALGIAVYSINNVFIERRGRTLLYIVLAVLSFLVIFLVKKYVLLCFIPAALLWIYAENLSRIRTVFFRVLLVPVVLALAIATSYYAVSKIGEDDPRYALGRLAATSKSTAYDIAFYTGRDAGSRYTLGELDGSLENMLALAPQAINVTLFRPYLWEVKNPLMLLSAVEGVCILIFSLWIFFKRPLQFFRLAGNPDALFCLAFSLTFAFAVGISTYNFGTLARYKIPLLPFYVIGLVLLYEYSDLSKSDKNVARLDSIE